MAEFSPADVAFTGARILRRNLPAAAVWTGLLFVAFLVMGVVVAATVGPRFAEMQRSISQAETVDPAQVMALIQLAAPINILGLLLALVLYPVAFATVNRAVLRPGESRRAYLRFGSDELNQFILMVVLWAVGVAAAITFGLVVGAVVVGSYFAFPRGVSLTILGASVAGVGAGLYLAIRLSLASAMIFDTGRLAIREAWAMTRGRFWPLFATYLLVWLLSVIVLLIGGFFSFTALLVVAMNGGDIGQQLASLRASGGPFAQPESAAALLTSPGALGFRLVMSAFYVLLLLLWLAPGAAIYRRLKEAG